MTVKGEPCILLASSHTKKTVFIQNWIKGQDATALWNGTSSFDGFSLSKPVCRLDTLEPIIFILIQLLNKERADVMWELESPCPTVPDELNPPCCDLFQAREVEN